MKCDREMGGVRTPIAVLFIHGVEVRDPRYCEAAISRLQREFARHAQGRDGAGEALVVEPAYWVPVVAGHEDRLLEHTFDARTKPYYGMLDRLVAKVDAGSALALAPLAATGMLRSVPGITNMAFPTLRWLMTYFVGDAVAYQVTQNDSRVYDAIHARVDAALHLLAKRAGPDAPLCVIAHSLGTVIASDYIWDQQRQSGRLRRSPGPAVSAKRATPLERCQTLAFLYTLGCPIALWTLRYDDFGEPVTFPAPELAARHPGLSPEWVNFHDRDDIVAYPLRGLSPKYAAAVREDRAVAVGPPVVRDTPLSHPWYWNDSSVMGPIARSLADAWISMQELGGAAASGLGKSQAAR
jgi:hypothetical protein